MQPKLRETMDTGLVHRLVCQFTYPPPNFRWYSLIDPGGMARWVGVGAAGEIRTRDLVVASQARYHTATSAP